MSLSLVGKGDIKERWLRMKKDRILSTAGVCPSNATKLRSYCNLIRGSLTDNWLFADEFVDCHVCFILDEYLETIAESNKSQAQVVVVVKKTPHITVDEHKYKYQITPPLNTTTIRGVLNRISREVHFTPVGNDEVQESNLLEKKSVANRFKSAFESIRSTFLGRKGREMVQIEQDRKKKFISRITQKIQLEQIKLKKVVFLGSPGSGKTTALQTVSDGKALGSEVAATDIVAKDKEKTTVGIDYSEVQVNDGLKLQLFGTPGQVKFNFLWDVVGKSADAFVILMDLSRPEPMMYLKFYLRFLHTEIGNSENVFCALTHCDLFPVDLASFKDLIESEFPKLSGIYSIDPRSKDDVMILLEDVIDNLSSADLSQDIENKQNITNPKAFKLIKS